MDSSVRSIRTISFRPPAAWVSAATCASTSAARARSRSAGASTPRGWTPTPVTWPRWMTRCAARSGQPGGTSRPAGPRSSRGTHRPIAGEEAGVVGAQHAVENGAADVVGKNPVVVHRCPRRVREVRDADARHGVAQHPRDERQMVVLHQHARGRRRRCRGRPRVPPRTPRCRPRRTASRAGTRAEARLDRGVEQQVVNEPQGGVGHRVVGALEGGGRYVKRAYRGPAARGPASTPNRLPSDPAGRPPGRRH